MQPRSLVLELQSDAMSGKVGITDLLRKAFVIAKKLKVREFEAWVTQELDGYGDTPKDEMPLHRIMRGSPMAFNPYHGWQPIFCPTNETQLALSEIANNQSIAEVECLIQSSEPGGWFQVDYPGDVAQELMDNMPVELQPALRFQTPALVKIVEGVRNIVLRWAMKLEEDGILGEGLSFSPGEVAKAEQAHYTINFFAGDVMNSQVQQGTINSRQSRI